MNQLPAKWKRVLEDAAAAGMNVEGQIVRTGKTRRSVGVFLHHDGTATRTDIELYTATAIRTEAEVRKLLQLPKGS